MNITVFLLKKIIFILNFSFSMCSNLGLFAQTWGLKGFATFWEFPFYGQKKVADYEYHSLFAEKNHFHT